MPPTYAACVATPEIVTRRFAERANAGQLAPGEQPPSALFRAVMLRELPVMASPDGMGSEEGEDKPGTGAPERYPFVMSMATPDGASDIVEQDWDLSRFMQNPIALYNHNSWSYPVGYWANVRVEGGMLKGDMVPTPVDEHEQAIIVAGLLKAGALRAASVGFVPSSVTERSKFPATHAYYAERGLVYGRPVLLECSVVNIPMHPDATNGRSLTPEPPPAPVEATPEPTATTDPGEPDTFDLDIDTIDRVLASLPDPVDSTAALLAELFPVSVS